MLGRVEDRIRRRGQRMDHDWQRRYYHRQQILQMQLGILEQNHSEGVRGRAHMMCRGMTDLSPDSQSDPGPEIEEENEPEAEGGGGEGESIDTYVYTTGTAMDDRMRQHVDEQDGYFTSSTLPGRSLPAGTTQTAQEDDREPESDNNSDDEETASQMRRRYLQSSLDEVSDPEYWQQLHHFDSEPESSGDDNTNH